MPSPGPSPVSLREATRTWFAISWQTFGGTAGHIAVLHRTLVEEKRWIGQQRFLFALSYCTLLPGPEAQQLATYVGWLLHGLRGALVAGVLFVLPGAACLLVLSALYVAYDDTPAVDALFAGIAPVVVAIVVQAMLRLARTSLPSAGLVAIAVVSFVVLTATTVPFPLVIAAAALAGWLLARRVPAPPLAPQAPGPAPLISDDALHHAQPQARRSLLVLVVGVVVWVLPVAAAALLLGPRSTLVDQGVFFGGTALVTFGGAYAVLAFVAQHAVTTYGWLAPGEMVRGLALAESTPGPVVLVVQFVAFVGAYRAPGDLDPWVAGVLASVLVVWVSFVPSFVFILLGAPYVERLRQRAGLRAALSGITAAVVGVIGSLAVYFAVHTLFTDTVVVGRGPLHLELPVPGSISPAALAIALVAGALVARGWGVLRLLLLGAVTGVVLALLA